MNNDLCRQGDAVRRMSAIPTMGLGTGRQGVQEWTAGLSRPPRDSSSAHVIGDCQWSACRHGVAVHGGDIPVAPGVAAQVRRGGTQWRGSGPVRVRYPPHVGGRSTGDCPDYGRGIEADFAALRLRNHSTSGKRLRYLLARIEKQLSGADITDDGMTATVEHILPENLGEAGWEHFTADGHDRSDERVGNYSLLERSLNGRHAGNAAFARKQFVYQQSQDRTSLSLAQFTDWTEETIAKRQADMVKVAKAIWALTF